MTNLYDDDAEEMFSNNMLATNISCVPGQERRKLIRENSLRDLRRNRCKCAETSDPCMCGNRGMLMGFRELQLTMISLLVCSPSHVADALLIAVLRLHGTVPVLGHVGRQRGLDPGLRDEHPAVGGARRSAR